MGESLMHILLINVNPVVSRMLILCTRDKDIVLEESDSIHTIENKAYDIIFIDESAYDTNTPQILVTYPSSRKVFISYEISENKLFDYFLKKPFLPSQIINIIEECLLLSQKKAESVVLEEATIESTDTSVLNLDEIEKIKSLLEMDESSKEENEACTDDALELRKREVIKQQLIAEGLEIVDEKEMIEDLYIHYDDVKEKVSKKALLAKHSEEIELCIAKVVKQMKKKQIKKLLNGKEIEIKIKLKGKN
jgi:hypothetical protein